MIMRSIGVHGTPCYATLVKIRDAGVKTLIIRGKCYRIETQIAPAARQLQHTIKPALTEALEAA